MYYQIWGNVNRNARSVKYFIAISQQVARLFNICPKTYMSLDGNQVIITLYHTVHFCSIFTELILKVAWGIRGYTCLT